MAASSAVTLSRSVVAAPANCLSSSAAFGSSGVQKLAVVRPSVKASCKIEGARASLNDEERSSAKPQMLVAIVAAGAALALNAVPVSPAAAGFFGGGDAKVERSSSGLLGSEGTGTKVGSNSDVRGSAGTPFGEGAGNKVGENSAARGSASTGSPFGEGSKSGSGANLSPPNIGEAAEKAKASVQGSSAPSVDPLKSIGDLNPFKSSGTPDVSSAASDAKNAVSDAAGTASDAKKSISGIGNLNPFKSSGTPDVAGAASDAKKSVSGIGNLNPFKSSGTPDVAGAAAEAKKSASGVAGLFDGASNVERGSSSDFPGNEGTGNKVGDNSDVRGSVGTPLGEGAGNIVGDNSGARGAASTGTPFGEGSSSGSGVNVGDAFQGVPDIGGAAGNAKGALQGAVPSVDPLKTTIGNMNPFKNGTSDAAGAAADAKKSAMDVAGDVKSKLPGGN